MSKAADYEKLIVQLGRETYLIEYRKGQYIRTISGPIGLQYAITTVAGAKEHFFKTKQQLSVLLNKLVADRYSSTKG